MPRLSAGRLDWEGRGEPGLARVGPPHPAHAGRLANSIAATRALREPTRPSFDFTDGVISYEVAEKIDDKEFTVDD